MSVLVPSSSVSERELGADEATGSVQSPVLRLLERLVELDEDALPGLGRVRSSGSELDASDPIAPVPVPAAGASCVAQRGAGRRCISEMPVKVEAGDGPVGGVVAGQATNPIGHRAADGGGTLRWFVANFCFRFVPAGRPGPSSAVAG